MRLHRETLILSTSAPIEIIDMTERVRDLFQRFPVANGHVTIFCPHTTAFVSLNERETCLQTDMLDFLRRLAPADLPYGHNRAPIDGRLNAHSHLLGLFMNASETVPVAGGELLLGQWQSIFFMELDGPRPSRQLHLQILGEA